MNENEKIKYLIEALIQSRMEFTGSLKQECIIDLDKQEQINSVYN